MSSFKPRVTILIPHFNNGRQSSSSGSLDLIGELLQSLHDTLHDDPTPFELLVNDDGSTDDSLDTLRAWAKRAWPNGQPFLHLTESPHEGFISAANNRMYRASAGRYLVRLDGDILTLTRHWVSRVCEYFDQGPPTLGILAPKQLGMNGRIHALGDWLLHPAGYTHACHGMDRHAVTYPFEVDHAMGCFYCCKRALFDDIGGYDEKCLRGETEDFTTMARARGWRCFATPDIEFIHRHAARKGRASKYDDPAEIRKDLAYYEQKWGFSRIAPDLDLIRERYRNSPLLWNPALHITRPATAPVDQPIHVQQSLWPRFASDANFQQAIQLRAQVAHQLITALQPPAACGFAILNLDQSQALIPHLLALRNLSTRNLYSDKNTLRFVQQCLANQNYPAPDSTKPRPVVAVPSAELLAGDRTLPGADNSLDAVLYLDVFRKHPNPVALIREAYRVLKPAGLMLIIEQPAGPQPWRPDDNEHFYDLNRLHNQVMLTNQYRWTLAGDITQQNTQQALILPARKA
ncbi:MAG: glycosyltransferase [Phycisphaerales bacterium]